MAIRRTARRSTIWACDRAGRRLYWADFGSNRVLRLELRTKVISVIAGKGTKVIPVMAVRRRLPNSARRMKFISIVETLPWPSVTVVVDTSI
jgi:hypothetical protein